MCDPIPPQVTYDCDIEVKSLTQLDHHILTYKLGSHVRSNAINNLFISFVATVSARC